MGDSVRIGVESLTHEGFLYILDREKYADGTYGQPTLLYPTLRYRVGDNLVKPGDVTFLPGPGREIIVTTDTLKNQVAEELIIIVTPKPLFALSQLQQDQIKVSSPQLLTWLRDWSVPEVQLDQLDTAGSLLSKREEAAGADQPKGLQERSLTQDDPLPQSIVEMKVKRGVPIITTFTLRIKEV